MESRVDNLMLPTGGKLTLPFEVFLIFSTNLNPEQLGDEAFLRRIQYKMLLKNPTREEFNQLFMNLCASKGLACSQTLLDLFVERHFIKPGYPFRRCHPRDVLSHVTDLIEFESLPHSLDEDVLARAFDTCFTHPTDLRE